MRMSFLDTSCPWSHLRTGKFSPFIIFHNLSSSRLNLMRTSKRIDIIMKCFFVKNKTLKILTSKNISSDDFIILTRNATNLRTLDTSGCSWMSYDLLKPVLKNNQKLRELHLSFSTQPQCRYLNYCPKIRTLILHDYPKMDQNRQFFLSYNNEAEANSLFFSVKILGCRSCSSPAFSIFTRLGNNFTQPSFKKQKPTSLKYVKCA